MTDSQGIYRQNRGMALAFQTPVLRSPAARRRLLIVSFLVCMVATSARAQEDPQIELNVITLPTTQSLQKHQSYFRLTHRFARDLTLGDFSDLAQDLFALDNGAILGLEYRFGITSNLHAGLHRSTLDKALQLFGRWDVARQSDSQAFGVSLVGSFEGLDNLQTAYQPAAAVVLSKTFGRTLALYASPTYVHDTFEAERIAAELEDEDHEHDHGAGEQEGEEHAEHEGEGTFFVGLAARWRMRPSVFVVGEFSPRVEGHDPGDAMWAVGIEKLTRGHTLALTLTNSYATTPGQIALGGTPSALYLGFNITRKF